MKTSTILLLVIAGAAMVAVSGSESDKLYQKEEQLYQEILAEPTDPAQHKLRGAQPSQNTAKPTSLVQAASSRRRSSSYSSRRRSSSYSSRRRYSSARRRSSVIVHSSGRRRRASVIVHTSRRRGYYGHVHVYSGRRRRRYHGDAVVGCFPKTATVQSKTRGKVAIHEVKVGEEVMTHHGFAEVMFFAVQQPEADANLLRITTSNATLVLTGTHGVFDAKGSPLLASKIRVGDTLLTAGKVDKVEPIRGKGLVAPVTATGTLVVDGVSTSDYGPLAHKIGQGAAHGALAPLRLLRWIFPSWKLWHNHDSTGKHVLMNWGTSLFGF